MKLESDHFMLLSEQKPSDQTNQFSTHAACYGKAPYFCTEEPEVLQPQLA